MKVLVTGANGYVGRHLCQLLSDRGDDVTGTVREMSAGPMPFRQLVIPDVAREGAWSRQLRGVDRVVHLAAVVHRPSGVSPDEYKEVNIEATRRLALACRDADVERFVFVSTAGVFGSSDVSARPFDELDATHPMGEYATSKRCAEVGLSAIDDLNFAVVRPPLVYGRGAPGNVARLDGWIRLGIPLPLKSIANSRSFVSVENLVRFLAVCVDRVDIERETFHVRDARDLSTPEFIRRQARIEGRRARLVAVAPELVRWSLRRVGRGSLEGQLLDSFRLADDRSRALLGWTPSDSWNEIGHD